MNPIWVIVRTTIEIVWIDIRLDLLNAYEFMLT